MAGEIISLDGTLRELFGEESAEMEKLVDQWVVKNAE
jgi:hypothetical protein